MSITSLEAFKSKLAERCNQQERRRLEVMELASIENLTDEQIERIKHDPTLGTYPYARLVMAAWKRQEHALRREAAERKAQAEREARMRI